MADRHDETGFASRLLRQDEPPTDAEYREYRRRLEDALAAAERRVRVTGYVVVGSCVVSLTLMFVGGSKVLGDFDPWSRDATAWSVAAGVVYVLATGLFFLSLASYCSRFRPRVRDAKDQLRDTAILGLQRQLRELREQAGRDARGAPDADQTNSG